MHTGPRAICLLVALAAAGADVAAAQNAAPNCGRAEGISLAASPAPNQLAEHQPSPVCAGVHATQSAAAQNASAIAFVAVRQSRSFCDSSVGPLSFASTANLDSRLQTSLADAHQRQLLFVKITRG